MDYKELYFKLSREIEEIYGMLEKIIQTFDEILCEMPDENK